LCLTAPDRKSVGPPEDKPPVAPGKELVSAFLRPEARLFQKSRASYAPVSSDYFLFTNSDFDVVRDNHHNKIPEIGSMVNKLAMQKKTTKP